MTNLIIGTAGHVDHGKTSLINALTGIDTDRLQEEKKRGITIELGFAYLDLPNQEKVGIIDVPGHEKFIKNMLAGAGGIDLALLVVAADEGFMPQTQEHLDILTLLNVERGIIVITKCDMADADWLEEIHADIRVHCKGTFLEHAPILETSAYTGQGIEALREKIIEMVSGMPKREIGKHFRLPIDRVFTIQGFGTVVTGTLIEGSLASDAAIEIFPGKQSARVRNIQVHGSSVPVAYVGQRVAVNIAGIKKEDLDRGYVLATPGSLEDSFILDVKLCLLPNIKRQVDNGDIVHFHHGSNVLLAKVILLSKDVLNAGESDFAQLRLTEPIALKAQDHFVIRFYSPLETIGGGIVINPSSQKRKRHKEEIIHQLEVQESGSLESQILGQINQNKQKLMSLSEIQKNLSLPKETLQDCVDQLVRSAQLYDCESDYYVTPEIIDFYADKLQKNLKFYHSQNKLLAGMNKHDARLQLFPKLKNNVSLKLMELALNKANVEPIGDSIRLHGFAPEYSPQQTALKQELLQLYQKSGIEAPLVSDILKTYARQKEDVQKLITALVFENALIPISGEYMLSAEAYQEIFRKTKAAWAKTDRFTLAEFRDLMQTSRKYALLLFDYWDSKKITKKIDDYRIWLTY